MPRKYTKSPDRPDKPKLHCIHCKGTFGGRNLGRHMAACMANPMSKKNFAQKFLSAVRDYIKTTRATPMEAVMDMGIKFGIDMDEAASLLDKSIKELIAEEAVALRMVKRVPSMEPNLPEPEPKESAD